MNVPVDLKQLDDLVSGEVVENTKGIKRDKKIGEKIGHVESKISDISSLRITTNLNTKIGEFVNKIPGTCGLVNTIVLDSKIK